MMNGMTAGREGRRDRRLIKNRGRGRRIEKVLQVPFVYFSDVSWKDLFRGLIWSWNSMLWGIIYIFFSFSAFIPFGNVLYPVLLLSQFV